MNSADVWHLRIHLALNARHQCANVCGQSLQGILLLINEQRSKTSEIKNLDVKNIYIVQ